MAKAKTQLFSEISGSFKQGVTFRKLPNKAKQIFQRKPIPSYTRTDKQDNVRTGYRRLCDIWKKAEWLDKTVYTNFAGIYKITPFNAWMKFNMPIMSRKPVLYLGMDEGQGTTAHDYSEFENNGEIIGATWQKLPTGKHCLSFDGVDDYVKVNDSPNINPTEEITVMVWFYPYSDTDTPAGVVLKHTWWGEYGIIYEKHERVSMFFGESNTNYVKGFTPKGSVQFNRWTFITMVGKSYSYLKGYINGEKVIEIDASDTPIGDTDNPLFLGRYSNNYSHSLIGLASIYSKATIEDEIKKIYETTRHLFGV